MTYADDIALDLTITAIPTLFSLITTLTSHNLMVFRRNFLAMADETHIGSLGIFSMLLIKFVIIIIPNFNFPRFFVFLTLIFMSGRTENPTGDIASYHKTFSFFCSYSFRQNFKIYFWHFWRVSRKPDLSVLNTLSSVKLYLLYTYICRRFLKKNCRFFVYAGNLSSRQFLRASEWELVSLTEV